MYHWMYQITLWHAPWPPCTIQLIPDDSMYGATYESIGPSRRHTYPSYTPTRTHTISTKLSFSPSPTISRIIQRHAKIWSLPYGAHTRRWDGRDRRRHCSSRPHSQATRTIVSAIKAAVSDAHHSIRPDRYSPNFSRSIHSVEQITADLSHNALKRILRMPWSTFVNLYGKISELER